MGTIISMVLLMACILSYLLEKKICNLVTFFLGLWTLVTFLSSLSLFGMLEISDKAYVIVLLGCLSFIVGYYSTRNKKIVFGKNVKKGNYRFNYKAVFAFQILCTFFLVIMVSRTITYIFSDNGLNALRNMYQGYSDNSIFINSNEEIFNNVVLAPFMFITVCVLAIMFFEKSVSSHKVVFVMGITDIVLYVMMNAGRVLLAFLALSFFMLFSVYSIKIKIDKKTKKKLVVLCALLVAVVYAITASRKSSIAEWDSIHQIYSYGAITPSLLDYWVDYIDQRGIMTFGMGFFNGFFSVLKIVYGRFGISIPIKEVTEEIIRQTELFVPVFINKNYNAFVSAFFFFYMDFRYLGVITGGLFLGIVSSQSYYSIKRNRNCWNLMVYLLVFYCLFKTITRWEFISPVYVLALLYTRVFVKKEGIES